MVEWKACESDDLLGVAVESVGFFAAALRGWRRGTTIQQSESIVVCAQLLGFNVMAMDEYFTQCRVNKLSVFQAEWTMASSELMESPVAPAGTCRRCEEAGRDTGHSV